MSHPLVEHTCTPPARFIHIVHRTLPHLSPASQLPEVAATLPKIDEEAWPFEGCQFGPWTATDQVQLFSTWKKDRKQIVTISKNEAVTAITGVHVTFEPSEIKVTAPMPAYGLKPGDMIYGYMYKGEGVFSAWYKGYWVEDFDGSGVPEAGCNRNCNARLLKEGRTEWWVEIKLTTEQPVGQKTPINSLARMRSASEPFWAITIHFA
jgi:hypothetical protein